MILFLKTKLLEEEEKEKREEEERKERRRTKEKEKKLRRKEKLREKEKDREKKCLDPNENHIVPDLQDKEPPTCGEVHNKDLVNEAGETISSRPVSPEIQDEQFLNGYISPNQQTHFNDYHDGDFDSSKDGNGSFSVDQSNYSRRKPKFRKEFQPDPTLRWSDRRRFAVASESGDTFSKSERRYHGDYNGLNKQIKSNSAKSNVRINGPKFGERYDPHSCSCYHYNEYRPKVEPHSSITQVGPEAKSVCKSDSVSDISKPYYRGTKYNQVDYTRENCGRSKIKNVNGNCPGRDLPHIRRVWEPMESQKYLRSNSDSDVTLGSSTFKDENHEPKKLLESSGAISSDDLKEARNCSPGGNGFYLEAKSPQCSKEGGYEEVEESPTEKSSLNGTGDPFTSSTSNSDSCSSCLSEGDSNTSSSNPQNPESSSTSDSEDTSQNSEGKETPISHGNGFPHKPTTEGGILPTKTGQKYDNGKPNASIGSQPQAILPPLQAQSLHFPMFQAPSIGYYHQSPVSWPAAPPHGMLPLAHPNHYVFASPFGYGLNGDSHFMQYGALPHLAPPTLNPGQVPLYPSVSLNQKDHSKISNPSEMKEAHHEANLKRTVRTDPPSAAGRQNGNSDKTQTANTGFSLFHFGGPVALSNGYKSKEGMVGDLSLNVPVDHIEGDHGCNKKDTIEEYNLFAASNRMRFSFF